MPTIGTAFTLADYQKLLDPDGKPARVIEMLRQRNEILDDMLWMEGNLDTGHRTTIETGLPAVVWRRFNEGVQSSTGATAQVDITCGMLNCRSDVDRDLAQLGGHTDAVRLRKGRQKIQGMSHELARSVIYEDEAVNAERITGLAMHYSTVNPATAASAANVVDAGGLGADNTSIFVVVWGEDQIFGVFPKGTQAGLVHHDHGLVPNVQDADGKPFTAYVDEYVWNAGLCVADWRQAVRIANIDVSDLRAGTGPDIGEFLIQGLHRIDALQAGRPAIYCNRTIKTWLDVQVYKAAKPATFSYDTFDGKRILAFRGIPIRTVDAILNTEARVV